MDQGQNKDSDASVSAPQRRSRRQAAKKSDKAVKATTSISSNLKPTSSRGRTSKKRVMPPTDEDESDAMDSEISDDNTGNEENEPDTGKKKAQKKRKHGTEQEVSQAASSRPQKAAKIVKQFTMCTYCGVNLSEALKQGGKVNLKRHFALKHAAALCHEMGMGEGPVCSKAFMQHLDCVDQVFQSLKSHGYKIVPACNYFKSFGSDWKISEVREMEKEHYFKGFVQDATKAFDTYQVVYLKGITVPNSFSDLLKEDDTNYDNIKWVSEKPAANNFSLKSYGLSQEETIAHCELIKNKLSNVVTEWSVRYDAMWKD